METKKEEKMLKTFLKSLVIFIVTTIICYFIISNITWLKEILNNIEYDKFYLIFLSGNLALIIDLLCSVIIDTTIENIKIKKIESSFKIEKIEYYRDLLEDISPAILARIYKKNSNIEDQIVATILNLEHKGKIKIENYKIVKINDTSGLEEHEQYLIDLLTNKEYIIEINNKKQNILKEFNILVENEITESNLVQIKEEEIKVYGVFEVLLFMGLAFAFVLPIASALDSGSFLAFVPGLIYFISLPISLIILYKIKFIIRTDKGIDLKVKLNGLKNYLKEFTNINENGIDKIKIYDEYILYAIIFNLKGELNKDSKKIFDNFIKQILNEEYL